MMTRDNFPRNPLAAFKRGFMRYVLGYETASLSTFGTRELYRIIGFRDGKDQPSDLPTMILSQLINQENAILAYRAQHQIDQQEISELRHDLEELENK